MSQQTDRALSELIEWVKMPSHKAEPESMREAAHFCARLLKEAGFTVRFVGSPEAPAIIARINPDAPKTLLFYSHYDVVAPGDEGAWTHPPFSGHVEDGVLHGRGSSDHKATFIARLEAVRRLLKSGELPLGIAFLIEGDEELGSRGLEQIIIDNRDMLTASGGLYSGGARTETGKPVIRAGGKGQIAIRLTVQLSNRDNHSKWAAIAPNPGWRLVAALNTLYDGDRDQLLTKGFLESALPPSAADEAALAKLNFDVDAFLKSSGHKRLRTDAQTDPLRTLLFVPTFNIAWLRSGPGSSTVLPGTASAMLDLRLVPGQTARGAEQTVRDHLASHGFGDVLIEVSKGSEPEKCDLDDLVIQSLYAAAVKVHGECDVYPMGPGSGPRYLFARHLGYSLVQDPGCSWSGSNDHAANENIIIEHFQQNIDLIEAFLRDYARRCADGGSAPSLGEATNNV